VIARVSRKAGEQRALRKRELLHLLSKVDLGRRVETVRALTEVDLVEVHFEDLVLRVGLLDADRENGFLDLPRERLLVREEEIPRELLRDGASALLGPARDHVVHERADGTHGIDAPVRVEAPVLDRKQRVDHRARDLAKRNERAVLFVELVNEL